jgi:hypothetical protein
MKSVCIILHNLMHCETATDVIECLAFDCERGHAIEQPLHRLGNGKLSLFDRRSWRWECVCDIYNDGNLPVVGSQRLCIESKIRLSKLRALLLTSAKSSSLGGLPGDEIFSHFERLIAIYQTLQRPLLDTHRRRGIECFDPWLSQCIFIPEYHSVLYAPFIQSIQTPLS